MIAEVNPVVLNPQQSSGIIHWMNDVEMKAQTIIETIPMMDDERLLEIYEQSQILGRCAWRIRAAVAYEILSRATSVKVGRGNKDNEEQGRVAVARKIAKQVGIAPKVLLEEAGIHATFLGNCLSARNNSETHGTYDHLAEKEFYRAAYYSDDPHSTLEFFAHQKSENPTYSTRDAWRHLKEQKTPPIDTPVPPLIEDECVRSWWERFADVVAGAPDRPGLRRLLNNVYDEVRNFVQRPSTDRRNQILNLIREGIDEHDLITHEIGADRIHVAKWLNSLCEDDVLVQFEKEAVEGARGQRRTGYRIIEEQPKK